MTDARRLVPVPESVARKALARWGGDPDSLTLLLHSGNSSWRVTVAGEPHVLRLTRVTHRSLEDNVVEMDFVSHLDAHGVAVAKPVPSRDGARVESLGEVSASLLTWAPGHVVEREGPEWNAGFLRHWGRALGEIHAAAREWKGPYRWEWRDESWLAAADSLLPPDATAIRTELAEVMARIGGLPDTPETMGMVHSDFGPQNFHWHPVRGITSFDFGNCCRHFWAWDVAVALSLLRRDPNRDSLRDAWLAGYGEMFPLPPAMRIEIKTFVRLRAIYVYLSRLWAFGERPTREQKATLATLREWVERGVEWPDLSIEPKPKRVVSP